MEGLQNKVALITGSSRGIGKAIAEAFAKEGAHVVVNYKSSKELAEQLIIELGHDSIAIPGDIAIENDRTSILDQIMTKYGRIDILVNNAGVRYSGNLSSLTQTGLEEIMGINLVGPFLLARDAAELMRNNSGHIINMSSVSGIVPRKDGGMVYGLTKSGLLYATKSLARQYAPEVRVNAIAPGYTETALFLDGHADEIPAIISKIPLKKINTVEAIADAAVYLCKASNITGHVLVIDGGSSL